MKIGPLQPMGPEPGTPRTGLGKPFIAATIRMNTVRIDSENQDSAEEEDIHAEVAVEPDENDGWSQPLDGDEGGLGPSDIEWRGTLPLIYQLPRSARPPVYFSIDKRYQVHPAAGSGKRISPIRTAIAWAVAQHLKENSIPLDYPGAWRDIPYIGNDGVLRRKAIKHWEVKCDSIADDLGRTFAHFILKVLNKESTPGSETLKAPPVSTELSKPELKREKIGEMVVNMSEFLPKFLDPPDSMEHLLQILSPAFEQMSNIGLISGWSVESQTNWKLTVSPQPGFVSSAKLDLSLKQYGAEYKSFGIFLANGDIIAPQALIYPALKTKRNPRHATRAGALRASAEAKARNGYFPAELAGEQWGKEHWQKFEKAQRQSSRNKKSRET